MARYQLSFEIGNTFPNVLTCLTILYHCFLFSHQASMWCPILRFTLCLYGMQLIRLYRVSQNYPNILVWHPKGRERQFYISSLCSSMVNLISNIVAHLVRQILFPKSPRNRKKCKVTPGRLICEFTAVDGSSLLIELLCMLCMIFSFGFSLRLLNGSYLLPICNKNFASPLAELLGSFERNYRITRRRLNPLFRLIFGQYSNFRGSQCIPRGYMDTRITWIWCYSSQLDSGLGCALFCSLYQPISLSRSPRQGIREWFSAQSGTADQVIPLLFPP